MVRGKGSKRSPDETFSEVVGSAAQLNNETANLSNLPVKKRKVSMAADDSSESEEEQTPMSASGLLGNEDERRMANAAYESYLPGETYETVFPHDSDMGIKTNMHEQRWERMFDLLLQVGKETGTCKVPLSYKVTQPDGSVIKLGLWLGTQRQLYRKGQLRKDKYERLQALVDEGKLEWGEVKSSSDDARWDRIFGYLVRYGEEHGHCNVPERFNLVLENGEHIKLGRWLDRQRGHMKRHKMRDDRMRKMHELMDRGMLIRDTQEEDEKRWNWCYDSLVNYGLEHGHCNVPHSYEVRLPNGRSAKLGVWLSTQRHLRKKPGKLRIDRAQKLQELVDRNLLKWGDVQVGKDQKWELCYMALIQYDLEHGNLAMPRNHESILPDGSKVRLYKWLQKQILAQKLGKLKLDRLAKLQELVNEGKFSWDARIEEELLGLRSSMGRLGSHLVDDDDDDSDSEMEELAEDEVDVLMHVAQHPNAATINAHLHGLIDPSMTLHHGIPLEYTSQAMGNDPHIPTQHI